MRHSTGSSTTASSPLASTAARPARRGVAYLIDLFIKVVAVLALSFLLLLGGFEFEHLYGWTAGLYAVVDRLQAVAANWEQAVQISVFLQTDATPDAARAFAT